jgi:hypothetical protein
MVEMNRAMHDAFSNSTLPRSEGRGEMSGSLKGCWVVKFVRRYQKAFWPN